MSPRKPDRFSINFERGEGVTALVTIGLAVVAVTAVGAAFAVLSILFLHVRNPLVLLIGLSIAFVPLYYIFPDGPISLWEVLPSAVVATGDLGNSGSYFPDLRSQCWQIRGLQHPRNHPLVDHVALFRQVRAAYRH